ncbi:MAG: MFS transporter [Anaplasmataceae bacterium]|nr:MFS transporter [Anaplasmataceae bacterium]
MGFTDFPFWHRVNRLIWILLFLLFTLNVAGGLFAPFFAVFIIDQIKGASFATIGIAIAIFSIVKSVIQLPLARFLDQKKGEYDYEILLYGALFSTIYTFGLIIIENLWQLYALSVLNGVAAAFFMAAYYGMFSRHIDEGNQAYEWSLLSVGGLTLSVAAGGVLGGVAVEVYGFAFTFFIAGVLHVFALFILMAIKQVSLFVFAKNPLPISSQSNLSSTKKKSYN